MDNSGCLIFSTFSVVVFCILYCLKEKSRKYLHEIFSMLYFPFCLRLYCEYCIASWRNGNISMVYSGCRLPFFHICILYTLLSHGEMDVSMDNTGCLISSFFSIVVICVLYCPMGKWKYLHGRKSSCDRAALPNTVPAA